MNYLKANKSAGEMKTILVCLRNVVNGCLLSWHHDVGDGKMFDLVSINWSALVVLFSLSISNLKQKHEANDRSRDRTGDGGHFGANCW